MKAKFRNRGQSCIAANRLYVQRAVFDEFRDRFVAATRKLNVGDGLEAGVEIGPLNDEKSVSQALEFIEDATNQGAKVLAAGGGRKERAFFSNRRCWKTCRRRRAARRRKSSRRSRR